jgi:hypothetical protein
MKGDVEGSGAACPATDAGSMASLIDLTRVQA